MTDVDAAPVAARSDLVAAAVERWAEQLRSLGGRNTLLHFRDLKVGTLDLAAADPEARRRLVDGVPTSVSRLFPHDPLRTSATRSARAIYVKARELAHERGLHACLLAVGIATWADPFAARRPTAPVLLRAAQLAPSGPGAADLVVTVDQRAEVNPVLLDAMATQLGLRVEPADLVDPAGELRYPYVVERLREFAPPHVVDGFSIAHRAVLGTFVQGGPTLADDLRASAGALARHDVVAALAGDHTARTSLADTSTAAAWPVLDPVELPLDTDPYQLAVVEAALGGGHLLVYAPPGTGVTQTVAALVAAATARGERVLVVAEPRPALEALLRRLRHTGLGDLVLDVPDREALRSGLLRGVAATVEASKATATAPSPPTSPPAGQLADLRRRVRGYRDELHRPRAPWGVSVYAAQEALLETPPAFRTPVRLPPQALHHLHGAAYADAVTELRDLAELGGLAGDSADSPWHGAALDFPEQAEDARDALLRLRYWGLTEVHDMATRAAVEVGLPGPQTLSESAATTGLVDRAGRLLEMFASTVWDAPLDDLVAATADRSWRRAHGSGLRWPTRRRMHQQARELLRTEAGVVDSTRLHGMLVEARDLLSRWRDQARDGRAPRVGEHHDAARHAVEGARADLDAVVGAAPGAADLVDLSFADARRRLDELATADEALLRIPRLRGLRESLSQAGLGSLLDALRTRDPDHAAAALQHAWFASLLERWRAELTHRRDGDALDPRDSAALDRAEEDLRAATAARRAAVGEELRRDHAQRIRDVCDEHPEQAALLAAEAAIHPRPLRDLVRAAPDLLHAARPCWLASPLVVNQVLPPGRSFDLVVVLEAGNLDPVHAVPSLARGQRAVVVGDPFGLPPSSFRATVENGLREDLDVELGDGPDPESLLDALTPVLPVLALGREHRALDDRLVTFTLERFHAGRVEAAPSPDQASRLRHVLVDAQAGPEDPVESSSAEVDTVVELVIEHVRVRPHESLGVVTFTARHAQRIEAALHEAVARSPEDAEVLRADGAERFYVRDVEQLRGDVRDAIVLTFGHGATADGRLLYRFGAAGGAEGGRRLAVALTRARARLTVVSSFTGRDLNPRRLTTDGALAVRDLLDHLVAAATPPVGGGGPPEAGVLESSVAERLVAAGARVVQQGLGCTPWRIPIAVCDPSRPGRYVLAVDTDGPASATPPGGHDRGGHDRGGHDLDGHDLDGHDRDVARPEHLARLGWRLHRVRSAAWADDPEAEATRLLDAYHNAVEAADALEAAETAARTDELVGMPDEEVEAARASGTDRGTSPRGPRPRVSAGRAPAECAHPELVALARWVESDGALRTQAEAIRAVADHLGGSDDPLDPHDAAALRHAVRVGRALGAVPAAVAGQAEGGQSP